MSQKNQFQDLFDLQSRASARLRGSSARERIHRLRQLEHSLVKFESEIADALKSDFGKPFEEVLVTEIAPVVLELRHARRHLRNWMKPRRVGSPLALAGTTSHIRYDGKGPSLIISPWNYAIMLTLGPIASAVSAGCPVLVKPSELTPAASDVLSRLLASVFPREEVAVCCGGPDVAETLLELPFRHIYFTGSPAIGKKIMASASRHLASVTLELGGKSPAIVDASANLTATASRIIFGKFANSGQTCIAPDFLLVQKSVYPELVGKLISTLKVFYGEWKGDGALPSDLSRMISRDHTNRLVGLLDEAKTLGATLLAGGRSDVDQSFLEPTLLADVPPEARLMKEEIFGPILPIRTFDNVEVVLM